MAINSYALFHTLAASRTGLNAGEAAIEEHIAIAENIARVHPEDIIVSDHHTPTEAQQILRDVCGLNNQLVCTEDGKATGKVWRDVKSEHHLGDNIHNDFDCPRQHGIPAELTTLWQLTDPEKACGDLGWAVREARLTTWHPDPVMRGLQLHQIERNFPFLLKVAHLLDAKMRSEGFTRLLLCARDCYLLHQLMAALFTGYEIEYFYNSRLMRYRPTDSYAEYAKGMIGDRTLIVDMCGSGNSLKYFCGSFGGTPFLVVSAWQNVPSLIAGGMRETSNPAPHPTVASWPVVLGDADPRVQAMIDAFLACVRIAARGIPAPTYSLYSALRRMEDPATQCLWEDHLKDSRETYNLLNSGTLPHPVIF